MPSPLLIIVDAGPIGDAQGIPVDAPAVKSKVVAEESDQVLRRGRGDIAACAASSGHFTPRTPRNFRHLQRETQDGPASWSYVGVENDESRLQLLPSAEHLLGIMPFEKPDAHDQVERVRFEMCKRRENIGIYDLVRSRSRFGQCSGGSRRHAGQWLNAGHMSGAGIKRRQSPATVSRRQFQYPSIFEKGAILLHDRLEKLPSSG